MPSIWCHESNTSNEIKLKTAQEDRLYLNLGEILNESGDLATSLYLYNQLIEKKELNQCYDRNYIEALYRAAHLYSFIDRDQTLQIVEKLKIHDRNLPKWEIINGYLVADKVSPEMTGEKEKLFFTKMFLASGLCESEADIEFTNGQIKIKMKPCCSCRKPQSQY